VKIAVCLSGQPRNFEKGFEFFNSSLSNYSPDYYLHHWFDKNGNEDSYHIYSSGYKGQVASTVDKDTELKMVDLFNPVSYVFEPQRDFSKIQYSTGRLNTNVETSLSMWYSRKKVFDIFKESIKKTCKVYDFVVWSRTDFAVLNGFDFVKELRDKNTYYTAYCDGPMWNSDHINTALIASSPENMIHFSELYDYFENYLREGVLFCDHRLTFTHLSRKTDKFKQILKENWMWIRNGKLSKS
jgi:hypothetical protein